MINPIVKIRHSLSLRLSLWVFFFAVLSFIISLGFMYVKSRNYVRDDAMQRAIKVLNNTSLRITEVLNEVEIATSNTEWLVRTHINPDSVVNYTRRIIELNPRFNGCSIAFEPYYFPEKGEYYSIYAGHEGDSIEVEQEGGEEYRYFDMDWYTIPKHTRQAGWVDPFYDFYLDDVYQQEMITTYSKPLYDADGNFIGVISTDISLKWLSQSVMSNKPSENSYFFMLGKEGNFFVHPDSTKLVFETIFTDRDPDYEADIFALGNAMLKGEEGMTRLMLDGEACYVFYHQLPQTGWSLAIVYPENEIFRGYNRLFYIVLGIIIGGLLLMLFFCSRIVNGAIEPVNELAHRARHIAAGNFDEPMEKSDRIDAVGLLQNSFCSMQQFISGYIRDIRSVNAEIERRNNELQQTNERVQLALEKKTAFMQDLTHQVRTPLNIIIGFAQVIRDGLKDVSPEELELILDAMQENAQNLLGIVDKLMAASILEKENKVEINGSFACNAICREVLERVKLKCPETVKKEFITSLPDSLPIYTHTTAFPSMLKQILDNANQFTKQGTITLEVCQNADKSLTFTITDTGIGIADEDVERIFIPFLKLDYFSEGLGIGLTLISRSAQLLGGTFTLDTTYKAGARFILTLPQDEQTIAGLRKRM